MGRILGVDLGAKRVGLALSDPLRTFGSPFATISRASEKSLVEQIIGLCARHQVDLVVIGMPYEADDRESAGCARARRVRDRLAERGLAAVLHDETWTSRDAEEALRQAGKTRRQARDKVDMIAASLILQDYLREAGEGRP